MKNFKIVLKAEVGSRAGVADILQSAGDAVLIQRGTPRWLLLKCPCGCGEDIPVNLDARAGKAWRIFRGERSGLSVFPSVRRDTGCESHFIIWRDWILMLGDGIGGGGSPHGTFDVTGLAQRVLDSWPSGRLVSYVEVADGLGEIPWDVQEACRQLVRAGNLVEGVGDQRGSFRLT
jgi:hypothetical protein